jgi:hypothetical protein
LLIYTHPSTTSLQVNSTDDLAAESWWLHCTIENFITNVQKHEGAASPSQ